MRIKFQFREIFKSKNDEYFVIKHLINYDLKKKS